MSVWRRFVRHKLALVGAVILLLIVIVAVFQSQLAPYDPYEVNPAFIGEGPSWAHPFGRDQIGRDLLSRVIYGTRVDLKVGFLATGISLILGSLLGTIGGYYGRVPDMLIMRFIDTLMAFPMLLLTMLIVATFGSNINYLLIAIGLPLSARYARVIRSEVLSIREKDYVTAARALGARNSGIIFKYVLINAFPPIIVLATFNVAEAILLEASLGFLGLGIQPPEPSWGSILGAGRAYLRSYPHIATFPGIAISLCIFGLNFVGEGLRDALDPWLKT